MSPSRKRAGGGQGRVLRIGLPKGSLQETTARLFAKAGALVTIRELLGHRLITSTQIYLHVTGQDLREAAARHPIGRLIGLSLWPHSTPVDTLVV